jgi:hypothetical protein
VHQYFQTVLLHGVVTSYVPKVNEIANCYGNSVAVIVLDSVILWILKYLMQADASNAKFCCFAYHGIWYFDWIWECFKFLLIIENWFLFCKGYHASYVIVVLLSFFQSRSLLTLCVMGTCNECLGIFTLRKVQRLWIRLLPLRSRQAPFLMETPYPIKT